MNRITDCTGHDWTITNVQGITAGSITVTMATNQGLDALYTCPANSNGSVYFNNNVYNVKLPPNGASGLNVNLKRQ